MHDRKGKEKGGQHYGYLWEELDNLLQFILKVCFQYPVGFIDNEALPKNSGT